MYTPQELHHLTVLDRDCVDIRWLKEHIMSVGSLFDWLIRISTAYIGGAGHVLMLGYMWTQHANGMSSINSRRFSTEWASLKRIVDHRYGTRTGEIPQYPVKTVLAHKY